MRQVWVEDKRGVRANREYRGYEAESRKEEFQGLRSGSWGCRRVENCWELNLADLRSLISVGLHLS